MRTSSGAPQHAPGRRAAHGPTFSKTPYGPFVNEELVGEALRPVRDQVVIARAEIMPTLAELGIGLVPFSPLGKGFLTGTVSASTEFTEGDVRTRIPRFTAEARDANEAVVDLIRRIARAKETTLAQVALAWILARAPWIAPIPGTRRLERLDENLASAELALTADDVAELDQASAAIDIHGDRYPEQMQAMIDR